MQSYIVRLCYVARSGKYELREHPERLEDPGPLLGRGAQLLVPEVLPRLRCLPVLTKSCHSNPGVPLAKPGIGDQSLGGPARARSTTPGPRRRRPGRAGFQVDLVVQMLQVSAPPGQPACSSIVGPGPSRRSTGQPGRPRGHASQDGRAQQAGLPGRRRSLVRFSQTENSGHGPHSCLPRTSVLTGRRSGPSRATRANDRKVAGGVDGGEPPAAEPGRQTAA